MTRIKNKCLYNIDLCCFDTSLRTKPYVKAVTSVLNIIVILLGFGLITIVAILYVYPSSYHFIKALDNIINVYKYMTILVIVSVGLILSGSSGFVYTIRESIRKLYVQIALTLIGWMIVVICMVFSLYGYDSYIDEGLYTAIHEFDPNNSSTLYMSVIQSHLSCCGNQSPLDYSKNHHFRPNNVPISCCDFLNNNITDFREICLYFHSVGFQMPSNFSHQLGCSERFHGIIIPSFIIGYSTFMGFMLFDIVISVVFYWAIKSKIRLIARKRIEKKCVFVGEIAGDSMDASMELDLLTLPTEFESLYDYPARPSNFVYQCSLYKELS